MAASDHSLGAVPRTARLGRRADRDQAAPPGPSPTTPPFCRGLDDLKIATSAQLGLPGRKVDAGDDPVAQGAQLCELGRVELVDDELADTADVAGRAGDELGVA